MEENVQKQGLHQQFSYILAVEIIYNKQRCKNDVDRETDLSPLFTLWK